MLTVSAVVIAATEIVVTAVLAINAVVSTSGAETAAVVRITFAPGVPAVDATPAFFLSALSSPFIRNMR